MLVHTYKYGHVICCDSYHANDMAKQTFIDHFHLIILSHLNKFSLTLINSMKYFVEKKTALAPKKY